MVTACLGFLVGRGVRSLDPEKVQGALVWERPTRSRDTEAFVGFAGFLRSHCAPEFAETSRALRELSSTRLERIGNLRERRRQLEGSLEASEVFGNGELVAHVPEIVWLRPDLHKGVGLRSGDIPWGYAQEESF